MLSRKNMQYDKYLSRNSQIAIKTSILTFHKHTIILP